MSNLQCIFNDEFSQLGKLGFNFRTFNFFWNKDIEIGMFRLVLGENQRIGTFIYFKFRELTNSKYSKKKKQRTNWLWVFKTCERTTNFS
jgi:hypothetical protein